MSGRAAERDSAKKDYRKQLKSVGKKYQAQKQELHALKKMVSKAAKNSKEFRKIKRKYAEKSDSDSSDSAGSYSDSESDSSASFESD
jgi:myo-inositol catabolism protein IolC